MSVTRANGRKRARRRKPLAVDPMLTAAAVTAAARAMRKNKVLVEEGYTFAANGRGERR
jgi:hypothetical protein